MTLAKCDCHNPEPEVLMQDESTADEIECHGEKNKKDTVVTVARKRKMNYN